MWQALAKAAAGVCWYQVHTNNNPYIPDVNVWQARAEAAAGGRWSLFPSCHVEGWLDGVKAATAEGKTALFIAEEAATYQVPGSITY